MITGNKGEWSEIYVLFRLLADGCLYAADEDMQRLEDLYFPIIKILRQENKDDLYEYVVDNTSGIIKIYLDKDFQKDISETEFEKQADILFENILNGSRRAFPLPDTEHFMKKIGCEKIAASSNDKTDITMQIRDVQTGYSPITGFSIKSHLGSAPTLLNASAATNFQYCVTGLSQKQIKDINTIDSDTTRTKIKDRISKIYELSDSVEFVKTINSRFTINLLHIDSRLHEILSYALIYHFRDGINSCLDVIAELEKDNPLVYPDVKIYESKFKDFLEAVALGMTPTKKWSGDYESSGGYIVVSASGDVLTYHIYNRDAFRKYLLNNTVFDHGSSSKHNFAMLYEENNEVFVNLNIQVRFK